MLKTIIFLLFMSQLTYAASDSDFHMRVSWVKTMKELMLDLEKKEGHLLVDSERTFLFRLQFIDEAWADARFDCFYGGWPSQKKGKYCQNPSRTNSYYDKSACKENELQCQPLLFGKGKCVPGSTQAERNKSFSNCEEKSDKNYEHLKNMSQKEIDEMREMSLLANEICETQTTSICKKVKDKVRDGLKAIDRAAIQVSTAVTESKPPTPTTPALDYSIMGDALPEVEDLKEDHPDDCEDPEHEHHKLALTISEVSIKSHDQLYEQMKAEFQTSPMCDPLKIVNDPVERPSGFMMTALQNDLREVDYIGNYTGQKEELLKKLSEKWSISPAIQNEVLPLIDQLKPFGIGSEETRKHLVSRIKGLILQDFINNNGRGSVEAAKEELVKNHIFTKNGSGVIECPFVSKDAFMKAMQGHGNLLKRYGPNVKNKSQITIVDYSRPSNERRMFVLDLSSNKVLHNTWVAHGQGEGGTETKGKDGLGSSPEMSNVPGSLKSSEGFIIAGQAASGKIFGPNILLRGVDKANTKMAERAVVLHGWGSPLDSYTEGLSKFNFDTGKYDPPFDVIERIKKTNFRTASFSDMDDAIVGLRISTGTNAFLNPTEGCLGVPKINMRHLDRKGRNKSQLELLREDLPGTVIFNYSGPQMESKYF